MLRCFSKYKLLSGLCFNDSFRLAREENERPDYLMIIQKRRDDLGISFETLKFRHDLTQIY